MFSYSLLIGIRPSYVIALNKSNFFAKYLKALEFYKQNYCPLWQFSRGGWKKDITNITI